MARNRTFKRISEQIGIDHIKPTSGQQQTAEGLGVDIRGLSRAAAGHVLSAVGNRVYRKAAVNIVQEKGLVSGMLVRIRGDPGVYCISAIRPWDGRVALQGKHGLFNPRNLTPVSSDQ